MELHHNWKVHASGPASLCAAVLCAFSPWLLGMLDREFIFGDWVGYVMAGIFFVGGVLQLDESRRPLRVHLDSEGIAWQKAGHQVRVGWPEMTRVAIESAPNSGKSSGPRLLTVWTTGTVGDGVEPDVQLHGLNGFRVADLGKVKEPSEQIDAALRQFAADRYRSMTK